MNSVKIQKKTKKTKNQGKREKQGEGGFGAMMKNLLKTLNGSIY